MNVKALIISVWLVCGLYIVQRAESAQTNSCINTSASPKANFSTSVALVFSNAAIEKFRCGNFLNRHLYATNVSEIIKHESNAIFSLQVLTTVLGNPDWKSAYDDRATNFGVGYYIADEGESIYQFMRIRVKNGRIDDIYFSWISDPSFGKPRKTFR